jgi:hypothetical protein
LRAHAHCKGTNNLLTSLDIDTHQQEEKLRAKELALLDEYQTPETAADFERLLVASPNSSYLWLKYMAFQLSLADIDVSYICSASCMIFVQHAHERCSVYASIMSMHAALENMLILY